MKKIKLTQGKYALVDDSDYEELNKHKWCALKRKKDKFYAVRNIYLTKEKTYMIFMHRLILQTPKGIDTDHLDGDGLNNQRSNLRVATKAQNQMNRGKNQNNTSGFKGVCLHKNNKWYSRIKVNYKIIHLGYFFTKEEASQAYIEACKKYHGEFANY